MRTPHRGCRARPAPRRSPRRRPPTRGSRGDLVELDLDQLPVALDFLKEPGVAVWILEGRERPVAVARRVQPGRLAGRAEVERLADLGTADEQLITSLHDVADAQVQAVERSGRHRADALADRDRAGRTGRDELDDPEVRTGRVARVDQQLEAALVDVEGLRAIDVTDRHDDELKRPIHVAGHVTPR